MVNVGKLWRGRRRDDGEGFEELLPLPWPYCPAARSKVLPQSSVGGRRVTCSCARVSPDFERRSSFVDAGWAEFLAQDGGRP